MRNAGGMNGKKGPRVFRVTATDIGKPPQQVFQHCKWQYQEYDASVARCKLDEGVRELGGRLPGRPLKKAGQGDRRWNARRK
jgi:hypothetical protein